MVNCVAKSVTVSDLLVTIHRLVHHSVVFTV